MKFAKRSPSTAIVLGTTFILGCDPVVPLEQDAEVVVVIADTQEPVVGAQVTLARGADGLASEDCANFANPIDQTRTDADGKALLEITTVCIGGIFGGCPEVATVSVAGETFCFEVELGAVREIIIGELRAGATLEGASYDLRVESIGAPREPESD